MLRRTIGLLAASSLVALASPVAAHAETVVPPRISALPTGATYDVGDDEARVRIGYRCTNATGQVHYLIVQLSQNGRPAYNRGLRNDNGGLLEATCTGKTVTQTVRLVRTSYFEDPEAVGLRKGKATLQVTVAPRSTPELGSWYVATGEDVVKSRTVSVTRVR